MNSVDFGKARTAQVNGDVLFLPDNVSSAMVGVPFGLEGTASLSDQWRVVPFFIWIPYLGGAVSASVKGQTVSENSIKPFASFTLGSDLVFEPWSLSIGSIWQEVTQSGANKRVHEIMFELSIYWGHPTIK